MSEWIKCTPDTMPDNGRLVLLCFAGIQEIVIGFYHNKWFEGNFTTYRRAKFHVSYWHELPRAPQE